jgi:hypothetical protein
MSPECPACQSPLQGGFVELRNTLGDFLIFGWSHLVLAFTDGDSFALDVLEPSQRKIAASCGRCGAVIITTEIWVP